MSTTLATLGKVINSLDMRISFIRRLLLFEIILLDIIKSRKRWIL
jgi:hypothetical protein